MRFTKVTTLVLTPTLARAFTSATPKMAKSGVSTRLAVRRDPSMLPLLRRSRMMHDFDKMFEEMDELMESSLASFPSRQRPFFSLMDKNNATDLELRRPLGFEVEPGEKEYAIKVFVPDVEAKDLHLNLEHDGRLLRLKGERHTEEGGMKVQSRFEKSILLAPDVDMKQLSANLTGNTLTVHAPKVETTKAVEEEKSEQIEIHYDEPKTATEDSPMEESAEESVEINGKA